MPGRSRRRWPTCTAAASSIRSSTPPLPSLRRCADGPAGLADVLRGRGHAGDGAGGGSHRAVVPRYAAPEALAGSETIETPVDVYGLGEILHYLLAGTHPYAPTAVLPLLHAKQSPADDVRGRNPMVTAPTARLVADLLDPDPIRRPTASAATP